MATPNQPNQGLVTRNDYRINYVRDFDDVRLREEKNPYELRPFFGRRTGNLEQWKEAQYTNTFDLPIQTEDSAPTPLLVPAEGFEQTWTAVTYRMGFEITEDAISMEKNPMIVRMMTGIVEAPRRKMELACAAIFDNGFTTETAPDALSVFNTAHKLEDAEHGTWSNRAASAGTFTTTSYFTAWLNFQTRVDAKGFPAPRVPSQVLYPIQIHEAVMKVRGSDQYPDDALNAKLPELFGKFTPVPMHWLSSTTAWFVRENVSEMDKSFIIYERVPPNFKPIDSPNPRIVMGRDMKMSFDVGVTQPHEWYGNSGA